MNHNEWTEILRVENKRVTFKCDTGAQINVLSLMDLKKIVNDDININMSETKSLIEVFGGGKLIPLGKIKLQVHPHVSIKNNDGINTEFLIVKENVRPILGLDSLLKLSLLNNTKVDTVNTKPVANNKEKDCVINKNVELFQGIGEFKNPLQLRIRPGVEPVVRPPRRVPSALLTRLADKLQALVKHEVIAKVDHPNSFVSNLVVVEKKDGSLRICLDPKDLNQVLIREHHLIPTLDEIVPRICNKKYFSVLDLSDGFYNIKLNEQSSDLCTFNSPFGCYKFLRLPFGLSIAPEIFQKYSERAFGDIPGVIVYCDDLLICGESEQEHDAILDKVFERAKEHNVRFNHNKFQYKLKQVKYFGHIFSEQGMQIDPDRVSAITSMKSPTNKKELQIFLGMVNYLRKFIPHLADVASPLQLLLKKNVEWLWTSVHEDVYSKIKNKISKAPVLQNFNDNLPITIQCDASKDGLGCCLLQNGKPVSFASRSLTPAERNFSQIEKELLSVAWSTRKFHYYIYGRKVTVLNDHKPLESLFKKHLHEVPSPRLQRLKLKLLKYDIEFKYLQGRFMFIADLLSRSYQNTENTDESYMHEIVHCIGLAHNFECTEEQKTQLITESSQDSELKILRNFINNGWPNSKDIPDGLHSYYKLRGELSLDNDLVFFNDRLIVPVNLRSSFMKTLHEGHIGTTKMKQIARNLYYWPHIDSHIEEYVRKCYPCQMYQNSNIKEPLLSHNIPRLPWAKLATDIMDFKAKSYLVVYDYYSKWLDIKHINTKSARSIINALIDVFSYFGIPGEIVSDHVPFDSRECKEFAKEWGFTFVYTSPRYPQANGMAEKGVQIAKKMLYKCLEDKSDYRLSLLNYRASPVSGTNVSPSELLMNRRLRTKLLVSTHYLQPKMIRSADQQQFENIRNRNIKNYNKTSRFKSPFVVGQNIWFKKEVNSKVWLRGKITHVNPNRAYNLVDSNNVRYTRTSFHIRPA